MLSSRTLAGELSVHVKATVLQATMPARMKGCGMRRPWWETFSTMPGSRVESRTTLVISLLQSSVHCSRLGALDRIYCAVSRRWSRVYLSTCPAEFDKCDVLLSRRTKKECLLAARSSKVVTEGVARSEAESFCLVIQTFGLEKPAYTTVCAECCTIESLKRTGLVNTSV